MSRSLELVLFGHRPALVRRALEAGIGSLIVDLEQRGKEERQHGADTEINRDRPADLESLVAAGVPRRWCRVNPWGPWSDDEVAAVLAAGATHLLLPMVETPAQAEALLRRVDGRCAAGILVETREAVARAAELARLPLAAIYVGLNDLAISRGSACLFDALVDGTVERVREAFPDTPFGVAGVTVVDGGEPVPFPLLLGEMARLDADFSFLRRSFLRDAAERDWGREVAAVQRLWRQLRRRTEPQVAEQREALRRVVAAVRRRTA